MTDKQLQQIRERAEKATPGPWRHWDKRKEYKQSNAYGIVLHGMDNFTPWTPEDAAFIAHAREDIPALLAEVERLRAGYQRVIDAIQAARSNNRLVRPFDERIDNALVHIIGIADNVLDEE